MTGARPYREHVQRWSIVLSALGLCGVVASGCSAALQDAAPTVTPPVDPPPVAAVVAPDASPTTTPQPEEAPVDAPLPVTLTIVYDNNGPTFDTGPTDPPLRTGWGFACLVERGDDLLLFDTGGDAGILRNNLAALGVDAADIDVLVFSHYHSDHTGGLDALLDAGATPTSFVPASFPSAFTSNLAARTEVVEVTGPTELLHRIRTTGVMGSAIIEQALVIETPEGFVVVTGCAHPGIVEMVRAAAVDGRVALVLGGFHLKDADEHGIDETVSALEALGVDRAAPTHCTGDLATARFAAAFGDRFVPVGVGSILQVGP